MISIGERIAKTNLWNLGLLAVAVCLTLTTAAMARYAVEQYVIAQQRLTAADHVVKLISDSLTSENDMDEADLLYRPGGVILAWARQNRAINPEIGRASRYPFARREAHAGTKALSLRLARMSDVRAAHVLWAGTAVTAMLIALTASGAALGLILMRIVREKKSERVQVAERRAVLNADLRRAIVADEIGPYYQPLVSFQSGAVVGFEVLARWQHPSRGLLMPDQFIDAADEDGLLTDLTYRILRQACEDARSWPDDLRLSLNVAPSQLRDPLLAQGLLAILAETGMAPARIEIEVTEDGLITDLGMTKQLLSALQRHGITVSLDDFGTGYASFYQLCDLQFDKIKIDRSFVARLEASGEAHVIVRSIIGLGKGLGLKTTAEGIENAAQAAQLKEWGCDFGQGYLFGKAMTVAEADALLRLSKSPIFGPSNVRPKKTALHALSIVAQAAVDTSAQAVRRARAG